MEDSAWHGLVTDLQAPVLFRMQGLLQLPAHVLGRTGMCLDVMQQCEQHLPIALDIDPGHGTASGAVDADRQRAAFAALPVAFVDDLPAEFSEFGHAGHQHQAAALDADDVQQRVQEQLYFHEIAAHLVEAGGMLRRDFELPDEVQGCLHLAQQGFAGIIEEQRAVPSHGDQVLSGIGQGCQFRVVVGDIDGRAEYAEHGACLVPIGHAPGAEHRALAVQLEFDFGVVRLLPRHRVEVALVQA
ncbi:hypothetical protein D3C78_1177300 [compost metagenome]